MRSSGSQSDRRPRKVIDTASPIRVIAVPHRILPDMIRIAHRRLSGILMRKPARDAICDIP